MIGIEVAATPASLRRVNRRTIISLLLRMGMATKADLAKAAGMSQPTVGKITRELLDLGLIQEVSEEDAALTSLSRTAVAVRPGRPGQHLRLDTDRPRFLAIQLGIAEFCLAALPVLVEKEEEWTFRSNTPDNPGAWMDQLRQVCLEIPKETLCGVLVSVPGIVDETKGQVLFSPNLHWTERIPLAEMMSSVWNLPVLLIQEIRALALGQLVSDPASEDFLLVDFGRGVGGALVIGGKLYHNLLPLSGELGHTPILGNRRRCGCGAIGCLETLVSRSGLIESMKLACPGETADWPGLARYVENHGMTPWLAESLDATATVIAGALNVLGLRRVIITGSLNELPRAVFNHLAEGIQRGAMGARFGKVLVESAPRRRASGLVAAGIDRLLAPVHLPLC